MGGHWTIFCCYCIHTTVNKLGGFCWLVGYFHLVGISVRELLKMGYWVKGCLCLIVPGGDNLHYYGECWAVTFPNPLCASGAEQASPLPLNCLPNPSLDLIFYVCLFDWFKRLLVVVKYFTVWGGCCVYTRPKEVIGSLGAGATESCELYQTLVLWKSNKLFLLKEQ